MRDVGRGPPHTILERILEIRKRHPLTKNKFRAGRYVPSLQLDDEVYKLWRQDGVEAPGCAACPARLCCGGGCWFRRICAVGSPSKTHCTEQVLLLVRVTMAYLHRSPEVFELVRRGGQGSEAR